MISPPFRVARAFKALRASPAAAVTQPAPGSADLHASLPHALALGAVALAHLAIVWAVPVLPGQDLPQHLAYARILEGYADPGLPFAQYYALPEHAQSYFTTYYALSLLARASSVVTAARVLFSAYVVGMVVAFQALADAMDGRAAPAPGAARARRSWTGLLGAVVVWNPVVWMGFLPFMLTMPVVLAGYAAFVRGLAVSGGVPRRSAATVALVGAILVSVHLVGAGCFVLLTLTHALANGSRPAARLAGAALAGSAVAAIGWSLAGGAGMGAVGPVLARILEARGDGLDALTWILHIDWGTPLRKIDYAVLAFVGTLATRAKIILVAGAAALAGVVLHARRESAPHEASEASATRAQCRRTLVAFWAVCAFLPAAIQAPSDISFLDYRVIALAAALTLAFVDGRALEPLRARVALVLFAALVSGLMIRAVAGVAREASAVVALVERLDARAVLLAVPLHDGSDLIDPGNTVGHYWPMMFTVLRGGITTQFWGRFTPQLPVGYKPGRGVTAPNDRRPWELTRDQVLAATHVLVSYPDASDDDRALEGGRKAREILAVDSETVACEARSCLYRVLPRSK